MRPGPPESAAFPEWDGAARSPGGARRAGPLLLHLCAVLVFLGLWTWKLLDPNPVPEAISEHLTGDARFVAAKTLHACAYAALALLAVTLPVSNPWRWYFAGLIALHGVATEIGQTFVPGRHGCIQDVLIDWAGVCAALVVWRVWASWQAKGERGA